MKKRPVTASYVLFFILFWPDTYRILCGIGGSLLLTPIILKNPANTFELVMVHIMLAAIGYAATARPARSIAAFLQKQVVKSQQK